MRSSGVVLAGGSSRRMGQPKQLLEVDGRPMLEAVVAQANASRLDEVLVVLGANAGEIRRRVELGRAHVLINPRHETGMASSLRAGLASLDGRTGVAMIILGDQPDIDTGLLDSLLDLQKESGQPAAALSFAGLLQPPGVLRRELWPDVMSLEGDVGCRAVIRARPELVAALEVSGRKHPVDVDTPEDYERLVRR